MTICSLLAGTSIIMLINLLFSLEAADLIDSEVKFRHYLILNLAILLITFLAYHFAKWSVNNETMRAFLDYEIF